LLPLDLYRGTIYSVHTCFSLEPNVELAFFLVGWALDLFTKPKGKYKYLIIN
jgi:hypothetical protein